MITELMKRPKVQTGRCLKISQTYKKKSVQVSHGQTCMRKKSCQFSCRIKFFFHISTLLSVNRNAIVKRERSIKWLNNAFSHKKSIPGKKCEKFSVITQDFYQFKCQENLKKSDGNCLVRCTFAIKKNRLPNGEKMQENPLIRISPNHQNTKTANANLSISN